MIIHLIETIIDIIIQGYTLYAVYGWSIHLLGALWFSVAHLLIQLARRPTDSNDIELREMQPTELIILMLMNLIFNNNQIDYLGQ